MREEAVILSEAPSYGAQRRIPQNSMKILRFTQDDTFRIISLREEPMRAFIMINIVCLIAACSCGVKNEGPTPHKMIGMPNPASVHCNERGGRLEIVKDAQGNESGICHLPDGTVCEEWALFRNECGVQKKTD